MPRSHLGVWSVTASLPQPAAPLRQNTPNITHAAVHASANCPPGLRWWHSPEPLLEVLQLPKLDFRSSTCAIVFGSVTIHRKVIEGGTRSGCAAPVCYPIGHFTVLYFFFFFLNIPVIFFRLTMCMCVCNGVTQQVVPVVMLSATAMRSQCWFSFFLNTRWHCSTCWRLNVAYLVHRGFDDSDTAPHSYCYTVQSRDLFNYYLLMIDR